MSETSDRLAAPLPEVPEGTPTAPRVTGVAAVKQTERPHPLTPFIRGWILFVAILLAFGRQLIPNGRPEDGFQASDLHWLIPALGGAILLAAIAGFVSWYFTHFVIDDTELRVETGAIFRKSTKVSFERLQSVDLVQPFAARLFGLVELRLEAGAGDSTIKLRYLSRAKSGQLREYLLARAHGERTSLADSASGPIASSFTDLSAADIPLVTVTPKRLIGSFLLSSEWLVTFGIIVVLLALSTSFRAVQYALPGLIPLLISGFALISRRVITMYHFTLAESSRGLRVARGLTNLTSQSVPIDRIQGIKISQSLLWKPFGWYRVDVDVVGYTKSRNENDKNEATSVLLPVGDASQVQLALSRALPGIEVGSIELASPPGRARWLRWFDFWTLRYGWNERVMVTQHGWLTRVRDVVPHAKTQSVRIRQGPLQRALKLADVHIDTAQGPVNAVARQLDHQVARTLALNHLDPLRFRGDSSR